MSEAPTPGALARARAYFEGDQGRTALVFLRLILAGVFLFAAFPKLLDPVTFARDIDNYRFVPDALIGPIALMLPVAEVIIGIALLSGVFARGSPSPEA